MGALMSGDKKKIKNLPLLYRIILKFPKLSLESFSMEFQGIFWALIVPILLVCYTFLVLVFMFFLPSPINMLVTAVVTVFICGLCLRIILERELKIINTQMEAGGFEWDLKKSMKDYRKLLDKEESE
jgi:hypothetical protein